MQDNFFFAVRVVKIGTGCPERLGSLRLWRHLKLNQTWSWAACCSWACLGRGVGLGDLKRPLPTSTVLWFCLWLNHIFLAMRTACSTQDVGTQRCYTVEEYLMSCSHWRFLTGQFFCLLTWFCELLLKFLAISIAFDCLKVFSSMHKFRGLTVHSPLGHWWRYWVKPVSTLIAERSQCLLIFILRSDC